MKFVTVKYSCHLANGIFFSPAIIKDVDSKSIQTEAVFIKIEILLICCQATVLYFSNAFHILYISWVAESISYDWKYHSSLFFLFSFMFPVWYVSLRDFSWQIKTFQIHLPKQLSPRWLWFFFLYKFQGEIFVILFSWSFISSFHLMI